MGKRALLINPWITDFAAYDFWARPLGLLWIGAILRMNNVEVSLIDCLEKPLKNEKSNKIAYKEDGTGRFLKTEIPKPDVLSFVPRVYGRYGVTEEDFIQRLKDVEKPDIILVTSSMTYWYPGVFKAISILKEHWPEVNIVLGGRYATLCNTHAKTYSGADYVIPGFPGDSLRDVLSQILEFDIRIPAVFSDYSAPAHNLLNNTSIAAITTSIGCPYKCTYCVSNDLSGGYQMRAVPDVINEIDWLVNELNTSHIALYDDALLVNAENRLNVVLQHIINEGQKVNLYNPNAMHARLINQKTSTLMKEAGFTHMRIGYEFADEAYQKKTGGKVSTDDVKRAVGVLKSAGFRTEEIGVYILCGHPSQKYDFIKRAVDVAIDAGAAPILAEYSPIPGSVDFADAVKTFKHDPSTDPLLQNSSIILFQHPDITRKEFEDIKLLVKNTRTAIKSQK